MNGPRDLKIAGLAARIHGRQSALAGDTPGNRRGQSEAYHLAARAVAGDKEARRTVREQKANLRRVLKCVRPF